MKYLKGNFYHILNKIVGVFAIVLIWRGVWTAFDEIDKWLFGGNHITTALIAIVVGLLIVYRRGELWHDLDKL